MPIQRIQCTRQDNQSVKCWNFDTGDITDYFADIHPLIESGDAQYVGKDPKNYLVQKTLSNHIHYQDSAITDLEVINTLNTGLSPVYTTVRDDATQFTTMPADTNFATFEVQGTGVGIKWLVESVPGTTTIAHLRDNGNLALDGDIVTLKSRDEMEKFVFVSSATIPAPRVADAKTITTFSRIPEDGRSH